MTSASPNTPPGKFVVPSAGNHGTLTKILIGIIVLLVIAILGVVGEYTAGHVHKPGNPSMQQASSIPALTQNFASQSASESASTSANRNNPLATALTKAANNFTGVANVTSLSATFAGQVQTASTTTLTISTDTRTSIPVDNTTQFLDETKGGGKSVAFTTSSVTPGDYVIVQLTYSPAQQQVATTVTKITQAMFAAGQQTKSL